MTHRVVGDDGKMAVVDGDTVCSENARDLIDDRPPSSLYAVYRQYGKDVIRCQIVKVDELVSERPHPLKV